MIMMKSTGIKMIKRFAGVNGISYWARQIFGSEIKIV